MKVLVAGGSGLVGRCFVDLLKQSNIEYIATYNTRPISNGYSVNFFNEDTLTQFLKDHAPTVCVNCIVQRVLDVCENDWNATKKVNIDLPNILSRVCAKLNIHLIHLSTDYVFDGRVGPFSPDSSVNPLQNYGISKLISEKRVLSNLPSAMIVRTPVLYSDSIENLEENAVCLIGKKVLNQIESTKEDNYSIRRPVFIPDLCRFLLQSAQSLKSGIFHFYNPYDKTTKFQMANMIGKYLHLPTSHIYEADASQVGGADRPYDTQLTDSKYNIHIYDCLRINKGIEKSFQPLYHPPFSDKNMLNDIFFLFDLDGTLVDSEDIHYRAYKAAMADFGLEFSEYDFHRLINESIYPSALDKHVLRSKKNDYFRDLLTDLSFIPGAEKFLTYLLENNANLCVVTNTSLQNVQLMREKLPTLAMIQNWITREDTPESKPSGQPYQKAVDLFKKSEAYIVGFENTYAGVCSLESVTTRIYCITSRESPFFLKLKKKDIILVKNFTSSIFDSI